MPNIIDPSRRMSAPITNVPLERLEVQRPAGSDAAHRASSRSSLGGVGMARPPRLTLPPSPTKSEVNVASTSATETMKEGLEKTTRAGVDVARRSFWRKFLGVGVTVAALAMMSVATAGLGTAGLVGLGLTAGFAGKGSLDAVFSLMNWRNKKAEFQSRPPPFPFLQKLPESLRQSALGAGLFALGVSEKKAQFINGMADATLGLGAAFACGLDVAGVGGGFLALTPFVASQALGWASERLEQRRQRHAEAAHSRMDEVSAQTLQAMQDLNNLQVRLLDGAEPATPELKALHERAQKLQEDAEQMVGQLQTQLMNRVANKVAAGTAGVAAIALDGVSESASYMTDLLVKTPLPLIMVGAVLARTGVEAARAVRSERRDNDKVQRFEAQHAQLQAEIQKMQGELKTQLDALEQIRPQATDDPNPATESVSASVRSTISLSEPIPGDASRYV